MTTDEKKWKEKAASSPSQFSVWMLFPPFALGSFCNVPMSEPEKGSVPIPVKQVVVFFHLKNYKRLPLQLFMEKKVLPGYI